MWLHEMHEMKVGENSHFIKIVFQEIQPPERLAWRESASDADWNPTANPMMPFCPRVLSTTVTFEDAGPKPRMRFAWAPHEPTEVEIVCFRAAMDNLGSGWGAGFEVMNQILTELQA
jgi:uncharacterized protein YndB with AHSA1/START domain